MVLSVQALLRSSECSEVTGQNTYMPGCTLMQTLGGCVCDPSQWQAIHLALLLNLWMTLPQCHLYIHQSCSMAVVEVMQQQW